MSDDPLWDSHMRSIRAAAVFSRLTDIHSLRVELEGWAKDAPFPDYLKVREAERDALALLELVHQWDRKRAETWGDAA